MKNTVVGAEANSPDSWTDSEGGEYPSIILQQDRFKCSLEVTKQYTNTGKGEIHLTRA